MSTSVEPKRAADQPPATDPSTPAKPPANNARVNAEGLSPIDV